MKGMICIRDARDEDLGFVHELNQTGVPNVNSLTRDEVDWFRGVSASFRVAELDEKAAAFLIALSPGVEYASLNYRYFSRRFSEFLYVDRIVTATWARRRRVAWTLYEDLESLAKRRGARRLCAEVNVRPRNDDSLVFHRRFGFREVGRQDTEGGAKKVVLLVKAVG